MRPLPSKTLPRLLEELAGRYPDYPAVISGSSIITFRALEQKAHRVASALHRWDIGPRDRVALLISNRVEWIEACFGASRLGATVVPLSTWSKQAEIDFLLADSSAAFLITLGGFGGQRFNDDLSVLIPSIASWDGNSPLRAERYPDLRGVVAIEGDGAVGFIDYPSFLASSSEQIPDASDPDRDAFILYTSGSTSHPKGVRFKHYGIIENGFNIGERQGLAPNDRILVPAPLFWSYGCANALPAAFTHAAGIVLLSRFESRQALDLIETHQCTGIYTLPGITNALIRDSNFSSRRTSSLRTGVSIGGAADIYAAAEVLGVPDICNIYGSSETYGNCCVTPHDWPLNKRASCQGPPLPGNTVRIRALDDERILAAGEIGRVEVKGYVTPGYHGASAALNTTSFTSDGYFKTGDLGQITHDGNFVFAGRESEMIKKSGINVSPAEVEDILLGHADVAAAAVVGVPDSETGEMVVAFIVPENNRTLDPQVVADYCRAVASSYKVPDKIFIRDSLPTTNTGKLLRKDLRLAAISLVQTKS
jgi:fatty-acyl-CoA synthase